MERETKHIGFFVTPYVHEYTTGIINGVRAALELENINLTLLSSTVQGYYDDVRPECVDCSFSVAADAQLDGYLVMFGVLRELSTINGRPNSGFLDFLPKDKTLIMEEEVPGYRCIYKDNATGMSEVMRHVLEDCGFRKVGMISGTKGSHGALERQRVYLDQMARHDLPVEEGWLINVNNNGVSQQELIDAYAAAHPELEAIVCATDPIALALYKSLEKVGRRPGVDVAVTGYDDQPSAAAAHPPLTTVHLEPFEFGFAAGMEAARMVRGEEPKQSRISGHLVVRSSCGERSQGSQQVLEQLVSLRPFPAVDIAWIILNACVKPNVAHADDRYLSGILPLVEVIFKHSQGLAAAGDLARELDATRLNRLSREEGRGVFRMGLLQEALSDYIYALLDVTTDRSRREDLMECMAWVNRVCMRYFDHRAIATEQTIMEQRVAMSRIIRGALGSADMSHALNSIMRGVAGVGCRNAFLVMVGRPLQLAVGRRVELPRRMQVVAGVVDGEPRVFADGLHPVGAGSLVQLAGHVGSTHTFSAIGLGEDSELIGFFFAETDNLPFSSFYFVSLQITYALRHAQIVQDEQRLIATLGETNMQLRQESFHDALSGLLNRRGFFKMLSAQLEVTQMPYGAIFYMDLDRFKAINDTFGHDVGDDAIKTAAAALQGCLRDDDLIARIGGDEFIFFAAVRSTGEAGIIRDRVTEALTRASGLMGKKPYVLRASIGYGTFKIEPNADIPSVVSLADANLYKVKLAHHTQN